MKLRFYTESTLIVNVIFNFLSFSLLSFKPLILIITYANKFPYINNAIDRKFQLINIFQVCKDAGEMTSGVLTKMD